MKGQLLRELLTESNAFGYLMGSGGPGAEAGQPAFTPLPHGCVGPVNVQHDGMAIYVQGKIHVPCCLSHLDVQAGS